MSAINRVCAAGEWGDSASQLQIITRRISSISAVFTMVAAVLDPGPHWTVIVMLSAAYTMYNILLSWRRSEPKLGELAANLSLCAGLTLAGAVYSNVLYHLLLMQMVLKVGRDRAVRMTMAISLVYLTAHIIWTDSVAAAFLLETVYNVLGFAVLSITALHMRKVMEMQMQHEGQIAELKRQNAHHYAMAHTDGLTGLLNHRAYLEKTADLSQYVLLVIDIDHFKKLNDTYGHLFGDQVLTTVGNIIKIGIRNKDMAFRYGGEEFALVLPGTALELGLKIAERLRYQVANCNFVHNGDPVKITISIGVSCKNPSAACQDAFREADSALYRAKKQGRNRCVVF